MDMVSKHDLDDLLLRSLKAPRLAHVDRRVLVQCVPHGRTGVSIIHNPSNDRKRCFTMDWRLQVA